MLFLFFKVSAQTDTTENEELYDWITVESKAQFPGGHDSMLRFIALNLVYPRITSEEGMSGTVVIAFVVEIDGSVSDVKVVSKRVLGFGLEEAAIAVVKKFPTFTPAKRQDEAVRMKMMVPIRFEL